jgi:hypothetical protein
MESHMKVYRGYTDRQDAIGDGVVVVVADGQGVRPLPHAQRHSAHFSWGYAGSGPADLARSILADYLGRVPPSSIYQQFQVTVVARWPQGQGWTLTESEIAAWLMASGADAYLSGEEDDE